MVSVFRPSELATAKEGREAINPESVIATKGVRWEQTEKAARLLKEAIETPPENPCGLVTIQPS